MGLTSTSEHRTEPERMIQEYVPGKQITLAHVIANPDKDVFKKLGLDETNTALGILTITPSEASIIASDIATKSGSVDLGFIDRFSGSVVLCGEVSEVEASLDQIVEQLHDILDFSVCKITRT
ncbi:BMC domain-containing protein [Levilactobacillus brevis]|uniref:BMC domain protein n=3 Tax=Levilactobacillus brevis TaxID=1580 RepID=U2QXN2_LEVBR|nr:BMC domain protein [Levilactobacillus brevis ATCC 14869 = DSM 20054]KIO99202.1 Propanediol utilization polyhedral body protein PduU [Levilactobacillus brevis]MCT3571782.1 BMC domain-containing protein [Levilactobacillus brevis]PBQ24591.1 BMC domain-containing protein [Levilactobacillus brevis]SQG81803.1 ethanolamine utilization protein EutS [Levilactobacillus brevis]